MLRFQKIPTRLAVGLALAILLDTGVQVFWKVAASNLPSADSSWGEFLQALPSNPLFLLVIFLMGFQFFNWLVVLSNADLSYAHPITALSYVTVFSTSFFYLHEKIDFMEVLGVACILTGVWFISRTDHKTADKGADIS